jgi:exopolyphosphatase/guanosine-5'-triphosphate,3'-diphosphate pyrophosphatase
VAERLAVVDLGSNAVRLVLARIRPGIEFRILHEERVQTRLGGGAAGTLPARAVRNTLAAVRDFLEEVRGGQALRVVAVATAAVREAPNAERLLDGLRRDTGIEPEILSGEEEARLGAIAVLRSMSIENGMVFDLGGGSLQLTQLQSGRPKPLASLPLGAVRTTLRFLRHDPPGRRELLALRHEARAWLAEPLRTAVPGVRLVGLGGTIRALGRIATGRRGAALHQLELKRDDLVAKRARLAGVPLVRRRRMRGLKAERADTIVAGAVVVEELMALGGWDAVTVCGHGVCYGLLVRETFPEVTGE